MFIRKFLIPKKLSIVFATNWTFSGDMSSTNCAFGVSRENKGLSFITDDIISSLGFLYTGHSNRKCISSSTLFGQNGQNRFSFGVFGCVCLPFSMFRTLLESLNFVSDCLTGMLVISCRYFSHPDSVLRRA